MDVKLYLALAGSLSVAYVAYNLYNKPRTIVISKDLTRRICQQIKHQMMIVCISYSKAMRKIRQDNAAKIKAKQEEIFMNFRNELSQVYVAKENLILKKYAVSRQTYGKSLEKAKHDKQILKNTEEIINMMERAIAGQLPDFTVPQQVHQSFNKEKLAEIYRDMVTLIGKRVTHKLQQQVNRNKNFNPNSDQDFRNAIRELGIYDVKVNFLKERGFKEEWGCPNEVFFKILEDQKSKDETYDKMIVAYEKCYEKIIELVSVDPIKMSDRQIEEMFAKALVVQVAPAKPAVVPVVQQPVKVVPVEAPKTFAQPIRSARKSEPVDQEAELEAMMMQQLLSRSQQPVRSVSQSSEIGDLGESLKLGMTSSEIQNDWQRNASLTDKAVNKLQEATEEVLIGQKDEKLIKHEIQVVEEALREQENEENKQEESSAVLGEESNIEEPQAESQLESQVEAPTVILEVEPVEVQQVQEPVTVVIEQVVVEEYVIEAPVEQVEQAPVEQVEQAPVVEQSNSQEEQAEEQAEEQVEQAAEEQVEQAAEQQHEA